MTNSRETHNIVRIGVRYFQRVHRLYHRVHGHEDVLVDDLHKAALVVLRVAGAVNDAHLFDEGTFARLSGAWRQRMQHQRSSSHHLTHHRACQPTQHGREQSNASPHRTSAVGRSGEDKRKNRRYNGQCLAHGNGHLRK